MNDNNAMIEHHEETTETMMQSNDMEKNLSESPRHQEWVEIENNGKKIHTFVVYPEVSEKASAVVLIHENKWLNDWARSMADQVAAEGYIVVAPDLLSEFSENKKNTNDFATPDEATQALYTIPPETVQSDLEAVVTYAKGLEAANGKVVSAWFCWGGSQSFSLATQSTDLSAALVFYGTAPEDESVFSNVSVPVYGFYGGADERVNATIAKTEEAMKANNKTYDYVIYDWAGHAFMRSGEASDSSPENKTARDQGFTRMMEILGQLQ